MTKTFSMIPDSQRDSSGFSQVLERELLKAGCTEARLIELADLVFVFDLPRRFSRAERKVRQSRGKKILLRFEPKAVNPLLYEPGVEQTYNIVLNIGGQDHLGCDPSPLKWPYFPHPNPAKPKQDNVHSPGAIRGHSQSSFGSKIHPISLIVSNKVSWSAPSNYGLRRRLALQRKKLNLCVFGMYWDDSRWKKLQKNLRIYLFLLSQGFLPKPIHLIENLGFGRIESIPAILDKFEVIAQSEFHLVIENSSTYVSEKLIDAMIGGAIPIYFGPELSVYGIPRDSYIRFPKQPEDQLQFLEKLKAVDKDSIHKRIQEFLDSPDGLQTWWPESVAKAIISRCV